MEADGDEKDLARILDVDASVLAGGDKTTLRQRAERAVACSADVSRRFVVVSLAEAEALRALCHSGGGAALRLRGLSATNAAFDGDSSVEASILGTRHYYPVDGQLDRRTARVYLCDVDLIRPMARWSSCGSWATKKRPRSPPAAIGGRPARVQAAAGEPGQPPAPLFGKATPRRGPRRRRACHASRCGGARSLPMSPPIASRRSTPTEMAF